jgi:hypothetical protein
MLRVRVLLVSYGLCLMALCEARTATAEELAVSPSANEAAGKMQKTPILKEKVRQEPISRVGPTALEVQLDTKEFAAWGKSATITKPQILTFRWSMNQPKAASGKWRVLDRAPIATKNPGAMSTPKLGVDKALPPKGGQQLGSVAVPIAPKQLAQGNVPVPSSGSHQSFEINFAPFIPKWPPVAPGVYSYWVSIRPLDAAKKPIGRESAPVKIDYKAPGPAPTFNICTKTSDCPTGEVCNPQKQECGPLIYTCKDNHLIVGTDGTTTDCSPYECIANTCRTSCQSVDDCIAPYVCNEDGQCIPIP